MHTETAIDRTVLNPSSATGSQVRVSWQRIAYVSMSIILAVLVWWVVTIRPYEPRTGLGYLLGIIGGVAMLILLLYPLRKHVRITKNLGPLRLWFRMHMFCGIFGPTLVLFHTGFHVGSINAAVALSCMLLVAASGIVGRFLYRNIHNGLYGSRSTLTESKQKLADLLSELEPQIDGMPELKICLDEFMRKSSEESVHWWQRVVNFLSLGWHRYQALSVVKQILFDRNKQVPMTDNVQNLITTIDQGFNAIHRTAQFRTYERLFSLWHMAHVPFVYLFVITAIAHVIAVHAY